jgi:hypothetical protein
MTKIEGMVNCAKLRSEVYIEAICTGKIATTITNGTVHIRQFIITLFIVENTISWYPAPMIRLTSVFVVVEKAKQGVTRIIYTLRVIEDIPVAVSPIFSINTKNINHTPNDRSFCIIVGADILTMLPMSGASSL